ncbi:hypothetical protein DIJ64_14155 [Mycobacterium leprae]|uniref:Uncharacterized protein n=1 Tax=Mycobacterium leprae TaxID=1769 RepID=A0AAD0KXI8_MYCLR|nr:hypothetical protein DIJ64_14155 [Mycobacterium leprae]OAX71233.1 hypothetical protein A3216_07075 [Mycobacterium leprae 7935681]
MIDQSWVLQWPATPLPTQPLLLASQSWFTVLANMFTTAVLFLNHTPVRSKLSFHQKMNMLFNPFHLVS